MGKSNEFFKIDKQRIETLRRAVEAGYEIDAQGRLVHRRVCWAAHGRYPTAWRVHHVDGDLKNNVGPNLIAMPKGLHVKVQRIMSKQKFRFSREQLGRLVAEYVKADKRGDEVINITIDAPIVPRKAVNVSGSSLDRGRRSKLVVD